MGNNPHLQGIPDFPVVVESEFFLALDCWRWSELGWSNERQSRFVDLWRGLSGVEPAKLRVQRDLYTDWPHKDPRT